MKSVILILFALTFPCFANEKIPVQPTPLPKAILNADGIPTNDVPGFEWQRWPGEDWKLVKVKVADSRPLNHIPDASKMLGGGTEALDEVNAARAARGLRPFLRDDNLTIGAASAAVFRAARGVAGHTQNDFAHLPPGCSADAAGCAAWPVGSGFGSCCMYENWTYAGAAFAIGADGQRYMHLFVRR